MAWGSQSEKEMIIGKVILEISQKNDVHNNYETDNSNSMSEILIFYLCIGIMLFSIMYNNMRKMYQNIYSI